MSALDQKQTCAVQNVMSALTPKSGHVQCKEECPLSANSGHCAATLNAEGGTPSSLTFFEIIR